MDFFKRDYLDDLLPEREGMHISLFTQFDREGDKWDANRIRLKNLLKEGAALWGEQETPFPEREVRLLAPDETDMMAAETAQGRPGRGLAIFWNPDYSVAYHLPYNPGEQIVMGHRFTLRPLLPLLEENGVFYFLTLSQKQVQLWRGDRYQLAEVAVPGMPEGMEEALALEDPERQLQFHTASGTPGAVQGRPAMFFGHDADKEKKGAVRRYLNEVAGVVDQFLRGQKLPLVAAGVGYLRPLYAEVSDYPHLLDDGITGNPDHKEGKDLHQEAWAIARPVLEQKKQEAVAQLTARQHTDQVAQELETIVPAATYGRVQALFVPPNGTGREQHAWRQYGNGAYDRPLTELKIATEEDLIDEALVQTLRHSGSVYLVDRPEADIELPAVLLRY